MVNLWDYLKAKKQLSGNQFRKRCKQDYLNYLRVREWQDVYFQVHQSMREMGFNINDEPANYQGVHSAILVGLLSHIGVKDPEKNDYRGSRNARFHIFPYRGYLKNSLNGLCLLSWSKPPNYGVESLQKFNRSG